MKHSSVLTLGLAATLALSGASAYASEPLNFDLSPAERSAAYTTAYTTVSAATNLSSQSLPSQIATDGKRSIQGSEPSKSSALPNLPLFELPPFQSESSKLDPADPAVANAMGESSNRQTQSDSSSPTYAEGESKSHSSDRYSASKPFTSGSQIQSSPFVFPDELTDADLFESDSIQANSSTPLNPSVSDSSSDSSRSNSSKLNSTPDSAPESAPDSIRQNNSETEFENLADADTGSLNGWFRSNHSDASRHGKSSELYPDTSSLSVAKADVPDSFMDSHFKEGTIGLDFDPPVQSYAFSSVPNSISSSESIAPLPPSVPSSAKNTSLDQLFQGDSDSLVAVAVGSAEGTRSPDGGKNPAYQGHTDPGNGVWNLGSFSYQHGASSPEEADAKQLARLRSQTQTILDMAAAKGLELTLEEKLNGIDLANQAPKAALDEYGGYIDWLAAARNSGLNGSDAILSARVRSFLDPHTKTWDAPGLGNSEERITMDQERRMLAIAKAIATYMQNIAERSSTPRSTQPVSHRMLNKSQPTTQLFTQKVIGLFTNAAEVSVSHDISKAEASELDLPIVEQILALDLSEFRAA